MKFLSIFSLLALADTAHAGSVGTCAEQWKCITFSVEKMDSSDVQCSVGDCPIEVCMEVDTGKDGCAKGADNSISHGCDASDNNGCAYDHPDPTKTGTPYFDQGDYEGACPVNATIGDGSTSTVLGSSKCEDVKKLKFCQEGVPGDTFYWILKDSDDNGANDTWTPTLTLQDDYGCTMTISCSGQLHTCGNKDSVSQFDFERTWSLTVGEDCHCPPTPAPTVTPPTEIDTPTPVPTPATPKPSVSTQTPTDSTLSPTDGPTSSPTGTKGDPHFLTWKGEQFDYHGQCDLVLVKDPDFADGLGLDVQIRTKLIRFWSYIKQASIRIGDDILEIMGTADKNDPNVYYWVNFEFQGELTTIGGFPVTLTAKHTNTKKRWFEIDLSSKYPGVKIVLGSWMEFVRVDFVNASKEAFGNTKGMLGDFETGVTLARDGFTILNDFTELGEDWQVMPSDNMLFHDTAEPQFPQKCIEPEDPMGERRRRLGEETVTYEQAEKACSSLKSETDRKDCVYDIIATQDLDMVGAY